MFNGKISKKLVATSFICMALLLGGCSSNTHQDKNATSGAQQTRTITDMAGHTVKVPMEAKRIADIWHANNQAVMLLGGADHIVGTTNVIHANPWINKFYPSIKKAAVLVHGQDTNIEAVAKTNPDLVLLFNDKQYKDVTSAGLTGVQVIFQDFAGLKKCVTITAEAMGGKAIERAKEYNKELDGNVALVKERTAKLTEGEKPKVLHIVGGQDLYKVDGPKSMIGEWIETAGGIDAITSGGPMTRVTIEQIVAANPDIIIIGGYDAQKGIDAIKADPAWKDIKAVKEGHLYKNPVGTFNWDRYSCEAALQVLWAAKLFHPDLFKDIDMVAKTKAFYKKYYNYDLNTDETNEILEGLRPSK